MQKIYEIRDAKTNDVLVNNLTPEEAIEQFELYQNFYGAGSVYMTHSRAPKAKHHMSTAQEYKIEYINYFAMLQEMGNLL